MTRAPPPAGPIEPTSGSGEIIEVRVGELRQLFNAIDPAPFRERDLDPRIEAFIVDWSRDLPADAALALRVHLDRVAGQANETALLRDAIHRYFAQRAVASRRRLRRLFHTGRISLGIGLAVLGALVALGQLIASRADGGIGEVVRESMLIGGWVAMWRPLEIFLYDWWPIRAEARLFDRLAAMPVAIEYASGIRPERTPHDMPPETEPGSGSSAS